MEKAATNPGCKIVLIRLFIVLTILVETSFPKIQTIPALRRKHRVTIDLMSMLAHAPFPRFIPHIYAL